MLCSRDTCKSDNPNLRKSLHVDLEKERVRRSFPVSHLSLSLLPLSRRRDLLWWFPVADVCLWLEKSEFIEGLDMAAPAYWKFPCEKIGSEWIFQKTVILNNVSKNADPVRLSMLKPGCTGK